MKHKWVGKQLGGDPSDAGSYEWVRYCKVCGFEDPGEDEIPSCPGSDDDYGTNFDKAVTNPKADNERKA